jgi:hypothetical protein
MDRPYRSHSNPSTVRGYGPHPSKGRSHSQTAPDSALPILVVLLLSSGFLVWTLERSRQTRDPAAAEQPVSTRGLRGESLLAAVKKAPQSLQKQWTASYESTPDPARPARLLAENGTATPTQHLHFDPATHELYLVLPDLPEPTHEELAVRTSAAGRAPPPLHPEPILHAHSHSDPTHPTTRTHTHAHPHARRDSGS